MDNVEENATVELVIRPPDRKKKGFLKRQRRLLAFNERWEAAQKSGQMTTELFDEMVDILLEMVVSPVDRTVAREALEDLSEDELNAVFQELKGEVETPSVPL